MNDIHGRWKEIAEEFSQRIVEGPRDQTLKNMINEDKDKFIKLLFDSKNSKLEQYQFNVEDYEDPEKVIHDKLFVLADTIYVTQPSEGITQTLLTGLGDSLLKCFSL